MNDRYEVYDHETCRLIATYYYGIPDGLREQLEGEGYMVRKHEFHRDNL